MLLYCALGYHAWFSGYKSEKKKSLLVGGCPAVIPLGMSALSPDKSIIGIREKRTRK